MIRKNLFQVLNFSKEWDFVSACITGSSAYSITHGTTVYQPLPLLKKTMVTSSLTIINNKVITASLRPANSLVFDSVYRNIISRTRFSGTLCCLRAHGISSQGTRSTGFFEINKYLMPGIFLFRKQFLQLSYTKNGIGI